MVLCLCDAKKCIHLLLPSFLVGLDTSVLESCTWPPGTSKWRHWHKNIVKQTASQEFSYQDHAPQKSTYLSVRTNPLSSKTGTFCIGFKLVNSGVLFSPMNMHIHNVMWGRVLVLHTNLCICRSILFTCWSLICMRTWTESLRPQAIISHHYLTHVESAHIINCLTRLFCKYIKLDLEGQCWTLAGDAPYLTSKPPQNVQLNHTAQIPCKETPQEKVLRPKSHWKPCFDWRTGRWHLAQPDTDQPISNSCTHPSWALRSGGWTVLCYGWGKYAPLCRAATTGPDTPPHTFSRPWFKYNSLIWQC